MSYATTASDVADAGLDMTYSAASGSTFAIGTTTVTVTATDDSGNVSTCTFDVTVADTTEPALTCPPALLPVEATSSAGATVIYNAAVVTDSGDDSVDVSYSAASGSTFAIGTTTVTVTATDDSSNVSTCTFDVVVTDINAPTITCAAAPASVEATSSAGAAVSYDAATCLLYTSDAAGRYSLCRSRWSPYH